MRRFHHNEVWMLAGLLVLAGVAGPIHGSLPPMRYKVEYNRTQEFDLASLGAPNQVSNLKFTGFITVSTMDTTGGQLAHIVLDSLTIQADGASFAAQFAQASADSAKGGFVHAYILNGRPKGTPKPSVAGNTVLGLVGSVANLLFPGAKPGTKVGDTWSDTTKVDTTIAQGGQEAHQTGVNTVKWSVSGMEGTALMLDGAATSHMNMDMNNGQTVEVTATGTHQAAWPGSGPTTRVTSKVSNNLLVNVPSVPTPISGTDVVTVTITPIS
jgi:hypothetical protein